MMKCLKNGEKDSYFFTLNKRKIMFRLHIYKFKCDKLEKHWTRSLKLD